MTKAIRTFTLVLRGPVLLIGAAVLVLLVIGLSLWGVLSLGGDDSAADLPVIQIGTAYQGNTFEETANSASGLSNTPGSDSSSVADQADGGSSGEGPDAADMHGGEGDAGTTVISARLRVQMGHPDASGVHPATGAGTSPSDSRAGGSAGR